MTKSQTVQLSVGCDSSVRTALHRYHRGDWFESLLCRQFSQAIFCLYNRDDVFYGILVITIAEILIAYDDNVGAYQCTIKVQEHSESIFEYQNGDFNDHSPFLVCMTFASFSIS